MIFNRKKQAEEQKQAEVASVFDDFNYDDTVESITAGLPGTEETENAQETAAVEELESRISDTPEEALLKQRLLRQREVEKEKAAQEAKHAQVFSHIPDFGEKKKKKRKIETPEERRKRKERENGETAIPEGWRRILTIIVTAPLLLIIGTMMLSQSGMLSGTMQQLSEIPQELVSEGVAPVQNFFNDIAGFITQGVRNIIRFQHIEEEYQKIVAANEELTYRAMFADELQKQLSQFESISDEVSQNTGMNPLVCRVIGRSDGNYFSTFTINRGSRDGVEQFMAVTMDGALVGYTETVYASSATVRTIIDSEASIAALISTSRDQGTVRGTLGVDGTAMCRMYYLPDNALPRRGSEVVTSGVGMSFPKGIPVGTVYESTRGMESNKSFVVVKPKADFEHIEYVVVLRYKPMALAVQASNNVSAYIEPVPLETARPYPTLRIGSASFYSSTATPVPEDFEATPTPTIEPTATPTAEPTNTPEPTPVDTTQVLEYHVATATPDGPTPTPTPEPTPEPTPFVTFSPDDLTLEED